MAVTTYPKKYAQAVLILILSSLCIFMAQSNVLCSTGPGSDGLPNFEHWVRVFSSLEDRSSGTQPSRSTANIIKEHFDSLGYQTTGFQLFDLPVRLKNRSQLTLSSSGATTDIDPFLSNAVSPATTPKEGLKGHLIYAGRGQIEMFNNKKVAGAIVLMDIDSASNWVNALSLGAKAVIYIYNGKPDKFLFKDKKELTPVTFPRFILPETKANDLLGDFRHNLATKEVPAVLFSDLKWTNTPAKNVYCLVPGQNEKLEDELLIVESFYDTSGFIPGKSPGADQSCSIATLMDLAAFLKTNPPQRPVLLVATAGYANSLAGTREMIWSLKVKSRTLKKKLAAAKKRSENLEIDIQALERFQDQKPLDEDQHARVNGNIQEMIKNRIDTMSNRLIQLRLESEPDADAIKQLAKNRLSFKRLEAEKGFQSLDPELQTHLFSLTEEAISTADRKKRSIQRRTDMLSSAKKFKTLVGSKKIQAVISLHLSSHGSGIGLFNEGWIYEYKETINSFPPYVKLNETFKTAALQTAEKLNTDNILQDSLRPSLQRSWDSYFKDTPPLGGQVGRLAGYLGLSIVTTNDSRRYWGTPFDRPDTVDMIRAESQARFVNHLLHGLAQVQTLSRERPPRDGFATLTARANFLRHGAVFADAPAPNSVIFSFQGPGLFYNMVDEFGDFTIKGVSTKKMTYHKVILEGYKFNPETGEVLWAVDKKRTTKARYRVKVTKPNLETDLIMFPCRQITTLDLLEPRTFKYMTKIQLLDARSDAPPVRYWWSRIDTRSSFLSSIYVDPGTRIKLALSDNLLTKKMILTHSQDNALQGKGYLVDKAPTISPTPFLAAKDMWALLNPRIDNLNEKGINSKKIIAFQTSGNQALSQAQASFEGKGYDHFFRSAGNALALAARVYTYVEDIQKDVLYGVLFYILLFAPFAFCLERLLFAFVNVYKRIAAFLGILILLIVVIYNVHPAFELAYSPVVVILAFFIIGLSAIVTWIIFRYFENEMQKLQRMGKTGKEGEISFSKAFFASFIMGINNLRRRKVRTFLTCTTLIILTFTVMSFTSVKSVRQHSKLLYDSHAPYQGILLKQMNWKTLPERAFEILRNTLSPSMTAAPRAWLETRGQTRPVHIEAAFREKSFTVNGLIGLSPQEADVTGIPDQLKKGRWFNTDDTYSVIIPDRVADHLGIKDFENNDIFINLWSIPFKVIGSFSGDDFDRFKDLDGEPLSSVTFPDELIEKTTDAEMEALESGDDLKTFQSRYKHISFAQTVIIPYRTLISLGGNLKSVAFKYKKAPDDDTAAVKISDRFGLWLFSGEKNGVFVYNTADSVSYSGLPNILIPILISFFIVLNTMINSVQERKKEIGIYTSIGMAPSHVSIIFVAEATAYAVLSVVSGYILAQVTAKVFAGTPLMEGLMVNYSSLGGVFAMFMVMVVVILSAIYPSRIAAEIAIPDVEKTWEIDIPRGDQLTIELPFLIKPWEKLSIFGFLYTLFDEYRSVSHGVFSVDELKTNGLHPHEAVSKKTDADRKDLNLSFKAWLSPFDLGIMQQVHFSAAPSKMFDRFDEIKMNLVRESGEHNTWYRVNKRFVNLIRKQLLTWRSLSDSEKLFYQQQLTDNEDTEAKFIEADK